MLQADRFLIIGVQKKAPHELWTVEVSADAALMEQGRRKYRRLLRAYAGQPAFPQPGDQLAARAAA